MVGTFFVVSTVLCLNLYIALLSETFNRVYQNATANASLLQANTIIQLEHTLTKKKKKGSYRLPPGRLRSIGKPSYLQKSSSK